MPKYGVDGELDQRIHALEGAIEAFLPVLHQLEEMIQHPERFDSQADPAGQLRGMRHKLTMTLVKYGSPWG